MIFFVLRHLRSVTKRAQFRPGMTQFEFNVFCWLKKSQKNNAYVDRNNLCDYVMNEIKRCNKLVAINQYVAVNDRLT